MSTASAVDIKMNMAAAPTVSPAMNVSMAILSTPVSRETISDEQVIPMCRAACTTYFDVRNPTRPLSLNILRPSRAEFRPITVHPNCKAIVWYDLHRKQLWSREQLHGLAFAELKTGEQRGCRPHLVKRPVDHRAASKTKIEREGGEMADRAAAQVEINLLQQLAREALLVRLIWLDCSAETTPMAGKENCRLGVAKLNQIPSGLVHNKSHRRIRRLQRTLRL